jgi:CRP-like cAMP-binding protein
MALEKYITKYPADSIIFEEGAVGSEMFIVKKGKIEIEISIKTGDELEVKSLGFIEEGDFFGEMSIIENSPRSARAIAREETELVVLNKNRFYRLIEHSPEFAIKIVRRLSSRLKDANNRTKEVLLLHKKSKIIPYLLEALQDGEEKAASLEIRSFMASLLKKAMDEEYEEDDVRDILAKLEFLQLIKLKKEKEIIVQDHKTIETLAKFIMLMDQSHSN